MSGASKIGKIMPTVLTGGLMGPEGLLNTQVIKKMTPDMPNLPDPVSMPDPEALNTERKRKISELRQRSGRVSTILSDSSTTKLGG